MQTKMESTYFFRSPAKKQTIQDPLHTIGYQVIKAAIKIDDKILENVKKACDHKTSFIFNHNEQQRNDFKRRQRNLPLNSHYMKQFDQTIKQIINSRVNTELMPTDPVIIHSRPGCHAQAAHCDYIPNNDLKNVADEQMPL